ncbi:Protein BUD31-2-like protein [Hordeum vulgare]|nr:Protein BUD31-2-like protein [Hordeum vulgare]
MLTVDDWSDGEERAGETERIGGEARTGAATTKRAGEANMERTGPVAATKELDGDDKGLVGGCRALETLAGQSCGGSYGQLQRMPKIKTSRVKYPEGWELIEPTLRDLEAKMREAENDTHDGKRKCEALWPIFRISHQKSRYIYDLYYRRKEIKKELYEFCLDQGYADKNLIAKWKKPGYERLCCLRCIQTRDHNFATTCVCRVPKHLREETVIECVHCGCKGCASGD